MAIGKRMDHIDVIKVNKKEEMEIRQKMRILQADRSEIYEDENTAENVIDERINAINKEIDQLIDQLWERKK